VDAEGKESHDMIASLVTKKKSQALTKFVGKKGQQANVTTESLPSNVHSMTAKQLRAVAASHGLKITSKMRKTDIIQLLQSEQEKESNSSTLMITDKASTSEKSGASKREIIEIESDSESDYDPDDY